MIDPGRCLIREKSWRRSCRSPIFTAESTKPEQNPRLKKRRRTQTPEEQLDDRDEDEEHVSNRWDLDDASYRERSSEWT